MAGTQALTGSWSTTSMARYRFVTEWQADAPVDRVWDVLLDYRNWPTWWRGFRSVEQIQAGEESGVGMVLRQRWRSLLPYTLVFDLAITDVRRHGFLEGRASGDVEGSCTWTFDESGGRTLVRFVMDVRTARWWMNVPVPFARRIFGFNYDAIMRWGSEGMARLLRTRVVDRTPELRAA
jgi:Polyketide cyclase / dehydrase and lipid transport